MRHVPRDALQQGLQRERTVFGVHARSLEVGLRHVFQDAGHVPADGVDRFQFDIEVAVGNRELRDVNIRIHRTQRRLILGEDPLESVGIQQFGVGEVADDLPRRPLSGDGGRIHLLGSHARQNGPENDGTVPVVVDQSLDRHVLTPVNIGHRLIRRPGPTLSELVQEVDQLYRNAPEACDRRAGPVQWIGMSAIQDCRRLVLATTNPHKLRELQSLLVSLDTPLVSLSDIGRTVPDAVENGSTLRDNARLKASHYARGLHEWVLSDDTGLEVDALNGAPGVRSARYAGDGATMTENRAKLLSEMEGRRDRSARFVCWIALSDPEGNIVVECSGSCRGLLRTEPVGQGGFGYDVLFEVAGLGRTLAELDEAETALFGHRGAAARHFINAWVPPATP
jgi:XTP/dITP diphosphohydrolase